VNEQKTDWRGLAEVASDTIGYECRHTGLPDESVPGGCPECWELGGKIADEVLAAGYRKRRTITTAAELDALRFQAVVLDTYGTPYVCERHATDGTRNEWRPAGMNHLDESEDILYHGDVTVVYEGEPLP
jgi:hypothetical protein